MTPRRRLIIFGCGNFADAVHYYFLHDSAYEIAAFTVDAALLKEESFHGLPVVPFEEVTTRYPAAGHDMFVAVGLREINRRRAAKVREAVDKGYRIASYVSSRAIVPVGFAAGPNTWIMEAAHVHPYAQVGDNNVIWGLSSIGLKTRMGNDCWVSGATVGESVTVGEGTFIGLGAVIASFKTVGKNNIVGAGAVVLKDTEDFQIYPGHASEASSVPSTRFARFNG
jgi:sugar O-acyltransferase (sialic acid O-acetyltransferase NeuD family)